jgi:hypothetical protein
VQNNTFVDLRIHNPWLGGILSFVGGPPAKTAYILQNNIFYVKDYWWIATDIAFITHDHNLYYYINYNTNPRTQLGFTPDSSEIFPVQNPDHTWNLPDPKFIDLQNFDLNLLSTSPAIDKGLSLGFTLDYDLNPVPYGSLPDIGAYEYQGK